MEKKLNIVVVTNESSTHVDIEGQGKDTVVVVHSLQEFKEAANSGSIDGLILDKDTDLDHYAPLGAMVNLGQTVVLGGPLSLSKSLQAIRDMLQNGQGELDQKDKPVTLDDYVETKFSEFVRAMKASSAKSLYSTLIHAVERPLIELALRETQGNQIQAAELLGLNRNTLRKKVVQYKIPLKGRTRSSRKLSTSTPSR